MARETEPQFTIVDERPNQERAARLALFLDVLREQPAVMAEILRARGTITAIKRDSRGLHRKDANMYTTRAVRAASPVLEFGDDEEAQPDRQTVLAMRKAVANEANAERDRRVVRLAALAGEFALYQETHPYEIPQEVEEEQVDASEIATAEDTELPTLRALLPHAGYVETA